MDARPLLTIGVTGTNGKTSTTRWVAAALACLGGPVARLDTLGATLDGDPFPVAGTYAGFEELMRACRHRGGRFAAIEVTSGALALGFARRWPCAIGVFTNLTRDHLDFHGTGEHYLASKAQLFAHLTPGGVAVLNAFDPASVPLARAVPRGVRVARYGVTGRARSGAIASGPLDLAGEVVALGWEGTRVALGAGAGELCIQAIGEAFAENAVAALAAAIAAGVPLDDARARIEATPPPPGRFEVVGRSPQVVVDYAHTPDALRWTLATARALCEGELWVVFGAGGDRDAGKRGPMGAAASLADHVVLTSDNPRSEDPGLIAGQIRERIDGRCRVEVELDREAAIARAIASAAPDDVVILAGKGHEEDQEVRGVKTPSSDRALATAAVARRTAPA